MKKHFKTILKVLVAIVCLTLVFRKIGFREILDEAAHMIWPLFCVALTLAFVNRGLMAFRWYLLLRAREIRVSFMEVLRIIFISSFVGMMVPVSVGVDAIRLYQIQKTQKDISNNTGSLVADRIISILVLCLFSMLGITLSWHSLPHLQSLFLILLAFSVSVIALIYVITAKWTFRICNRLVERVFQGLERVAENRPGLGRFSATLSNLWKIAGRFHGAISELIQNPKSLLPVSGLAFLVQLSRIAQFHFLFRGLGAEPAIAFELGLIPIVVLISLLPISPMGIGVKETAVVFFFNQIQIDGAISAATSLFTHVISLLVIIPGAYFFLAAKSRDSKPSPDQVNKESSAPK